MSVFDEILEGLDEAIEYESGNNRKKLRITKVKVVPIKRYSPADIKALRKRIAMSQAVFAMYLGVTKKTVEGWESGSKHPSGSACRLLQMIEISPERTISDYPFVSVQNSV